MADDQAIRFPYPVRLYPARAPGQHPRQLEQPQSHALQSIESYIGLFPGRLLRRVELTPRFAGLLTIPARPSSILVWRKSIACRSLFSVPSGIRESLANMGKVPVRLKEVVYTLSPYQQQVMASLWKDIPYKLGKKFHENWVSAFTLVVPIVGTYMYAENYREKEKLHHRY